MSVSSDKIHIIIVAAGSGSRFGGPLPKQFCDLAGRPVLMHAIDAFRQALPGASMSLVLSESCMQLWQDLCLRHGYDSPAVVPGGSSRYASVCNALPSIPDDAGIVMVHDGARPFPPVGHFEDYCRDIIESGFCGVVPAVPVTDSLRHIDPDGGNSSVNRAEYRAVQTPQVFDAALFVRAYRISKDISAEFTDDASVVAAAFPDRRISLGAGSYRNIKITNPGDLALAEFYINS